MTRLELRAIDQAGAEPLVFEVGRMVNAGYVGRNQEAVRAHIQELAREGIAPPASVPMLFAVQCRNVTTDRQIEVVEKQTSGEIEFVLLVQDHRIYVGVGSDHTDRRLEALSMLNSKQVCPNVMSEDVWDYEEVKAHWDELVLQSWVRPVPGVEWVLYQKAPLAGILSPADLLDLLKSRMTEEPGRGLVIFSGTIPVLTKEIIYGTSFRCELVDPVLQRRLACEYEIVLLEYLREGQAPVHGLRV